MRLFRRGDEDETTLYRELFQEHVFPIAETSMKD